MFTGPSQTGKETCARAARRVGIVSAVLVLVLAACGKERPFAEESSSDLDVPAAGGAPAEAPAAAGAAETCAEPPCTSSPEQVEPIGGVMSGAADTDQLSGASAPDAACADGATESCGPPAEEGTCRFGTRSCVAGSWGECAGSVLPGARDCSSVEDNDCDGQPDNTIDDVCRCPAAGTQPCDEHPGLDGRGACRAGVQTCILAADSATSDWGECSGSVGPQPADSCEVASDDADCDGTPNGGCTCVEGTIIACGPEADTGECVRGTSTCTNGQFTPCQGAVFPTRRDCTSGLDNDCDGLPDDTLDATCTCVVGETRACGAHPGRDGNGSCQAGQQVCQAGAQNGTSAFGACVGSVGPALRDLCTVPDDDSDCDGLPNDGCACIAGQGNAPCASDPNNSRCNAQGQCAPCQGNADCSLVGGGRNLCVAGVCSAASCGDGVTSVGEECDDGNSLDTDGCTNACRFAVCGDGFLQAPDEECDDRNTTDADGCSANCRVTRTPHGAVSFGAYHMCIPLVSGRVMCWGDNAFGQLGTGDNLDSATPLPVVNINNAVEVALSDLATCARLSDGTVRCWGLNGGGNLGSANAADSNIPVPVPNLTGVTQIAGGGSGFCAVVTNGGVFCWGDTNPANGPLASKNLQGIVQIAAGNAHFCGVRGNGTMACWGSNLSGQFGNGLQTDNSPAPPVETPLTDVAEVTAAGDSTCVRLRSGAVNCFGSGPLGDGTDDSSLVPVAVRNVNNAVKLAGAVGHFCALTTTRLVRCWGTTLGGGGASIPTTIPLPSDAVDIGAGAEASCAVLDDDSLRCWGSGFAGQLGTGAVLNDGSATPLQVLNVQ